MEMPINNDGIALLQEFESFAKTKPGKPNVAHAYQDMVGVWTIGWGFTKGVREGDTMTRAMADRRLAEELEEYVQPIRRACTGETTDNQLAAMACLAWNIGIAGFLKSTVLKCHNRGDYQAAARAFSLWNKAGGQVVRGLTRRRAAEAALYLKPMEGEAEPMPQRVDGESNLGRSPIITGTSITAGTATVGVVAEGARSVKDIRESLGDWLPVVLVVIAIGAAGWVIWSRVKQRRGGWA